MQIVYVAGPYRGKTIHETKLNFRRAEKVAEWLWSEGYAVICPHTNSSFIDGLIPDPQILDAYVAIMLKCDIVAAMPGCDRSEGAKAECCQALAGGVKIVLVNDTLDGWRDPNDVY